MSERQDELYRSGITDRHFLFYTESVGEVDRIIEAYKKGTAIDGKVRRI